MHLQAAATEIGMMRAVPNNDWGAREKC